MLSLVMKTWLTIMHALDKVFKIDLCSTFFLTFELWAMDFIQEMVIFTLAAILPMRNSLFKTNKI